MRTFSRLVLFVGFLFVTMVAVSSQVHCQDDKTAKLTVGYVTDGVVVPSPIEGVRNLNAISASLEPTVWIQKNEKNPNHGAKLSGVVYFKRQIHYYEIEEENVDTYAAGANFSYRIGKGGIFEPWAGLLVGVRYAEDEGRKFTDIIRAGVDLNFGHIGLRTEIGRQRTRNTFEAPTGSYVGGGITFRF